MNQRPSTVRKQRRGVSDFGFQVSGFGFRVSGFGFRVSVVESQVSGLGSRVSGLGFHHSFGFRVSGAECGARVMVSGALQVMVSGSMSTI